MRINNELASDLGLTTAAIGNALRPLIAGDQISTWLGPDGQNYDVIVQLPKERREIAADLGDLYVDQHAHRCRTASRCWCRCARSRSSSRPAARSRSSG